MGPGQEIFVGLGHAYGADVVENLLDWCHDLKIKSITLYVLSTENLQRTVEEIQELFRLIEERLTKLLEDERIYKYRVRVKGIGKFDLLPESLLARPPRGGGEDRVVRRPLPRTSLSRTGGGRRSRTS